MPKRPDTHTILQEITQMRTELISLTLRRDRLKFRICEQLEDQYQDKMGQYEYRAYRARYRALRMQKEIILIQLLFDVEEPVFLPSIASDLDDEFQPYISQIHARAERMKRANQHRRINKFYGSDEAELDNSYGNVALKLHPALAADGCCHYPALMRRMVIAYRDGNLYELKRLERETEDFPSLPFPFEYAELNAIHDTYRTRIQELRAEIGDIQTSYPYNIMHFLEDDISVYHMQCQIESETEQWEHACREYEQERYELLTGQDSM